MALAEVLADDPLIDEQLPAPDSEPSTWSDVQLRAMCVQLQRAAREATSLKGTRDAVVGAYNERLAVLVQHGEELRTSLRNVILNVRGGEPLRYPDVGTHYLTNKDAKRRLRWVAVGGQEEAVSHVGDDPEMLFHKKVFDAQAYMAHAQEQLETNGVLMPGVELYKPEPALAVRQ